MTMLNPPPNGPTWDYTKFKDWFYKLWINVKGIVGDGKGNTTFTGNVTVDGNLIGMPQSILAAGSGMQDGGLKYDAVPVPPPDGSYSSTLFASGMGEGTATYIGNTLTWGGAPIILIATNAGGQSIPNAAATTVTGWTTGLDTASAFVPSTGIYTIPISGVYHISASILMNTVVYPAQGATSLAVIQNSTTIYTYLTEYGSAQTASSFLQSSDSGLVQCKAGDTIKIQITQVSGAANTTYNGASAGSYNNLNIIRVA